MAQKQQTFMQGAGSDVKERAEGIPSSGIPAENEHEFDHTLPVTENDISAGYKYKAGAKRRKNVQRISAGI